MFPARPSASMTAYVAHSPCSLRRSTEASRICSTASRRSDEPGVRAWARRFGKNNSADVLPARIERRVNKRAWCAGESERMRRPTMHAIARCPEGGPRPLPQDSVFLSFSQLHRKFAFM
eukprot:scaffold12897_cov29-Tisochrysis_lutea.AAC.2